MKRAWCPVTQPVLASCGPVYLRLFPARTEPIPPDDLFDLPWAWGALCHVTFKIGELTTTKKVRVKFSYADDEPSADDLEAGRICVLAMLAEQLERHGFKPPDFTFAAVDVFDRAHDTGGE